MSVKVKLEKNGYIKNGFTGFSWTTIFFGFWVPLFRLKLKDFLKTLNTKWRLQDNSVIDITLGDTNLLYLKWILKFITGQNKYTKITLEIEKAKTVEDLEKIE